MLLNFIQQVPAGGNAVGGSANSAQTSTITATFPGSNTVGNSVLVLGYYITGWAGASATSGSAADTQLNTYSQLFFNGAGNQSGGGIAAYLAKNVVAGSNTVTFTFNYNCGVFTLSNGWNFGMVAIELSGLSPLTTLQAQSFSPIFGASGNTPVTVSLTDSLGATKTVTWGGTSGSGGPGTNGCMALFDLLSRGTDYIVAAALNGSGDTLTSSFATFTQRVSAPPSMPNFGTVGLYWDASPVTSKRPPLPWITT